MSIASLALALMQATHIAPQPPTQIVWQWDLDEPAPYMKRWVSPLPKSEQGPWIVAATAFGECRSGGVACMSATINVLQNRAKHDHKTLEQEALAAYQFSVWNCNDKGHPALWKIGKYPVDSSDGIAWTNARGLAKRAYANDLPDLTHGARFYLRYDCFPKWRKQMVPIARIGAHIFLRPLSHKELSAKEMKHANLPAHPSHLARATATDHAVHPSHRLSGSGGHL